MAASLHSQHPAPPPGEAPEDPADPVPDARSFWVGLRRFIAEALEEEARLCEKTRFGWWL
jgi:hypothetical protein